MMWSHIWIISFEVEGSSHHQLVSGCLLDLAHQGDDKLQARSRTAEGQPERSTWDLALWKIIVSCFFCKTDLFTTFKTRNNNKAHTLMELPVVWLKLPFRRQMQLGQSTWFRDSSWEWTLNMKTYATLPATVAILSNNRLCRWLNLNEPINDGSLEEMIPNSAVQVGIPSIQGLWSFIGPCVAYFSGTGVVWRVVWGVDETMTQQILNSFHNII